MTIEQLQWTAAGEWRVVRQADAPLSADLVFAFGATDVIDNPNRFDELRSRYPNAHILTCSTSGEIVGEAVYDDSIVATAVGFGSTRVSVTRLSVGDYPDSATIGTALVDRIPADDLVHLLVITDGQKVNGSDLARGLRVRLPDSVAVTGGLAGDGARFQKTLVGLDLPPTEGNCVAIGFYGGSLKVGYGSFGGFDSFGPDRIVTRSRGNVLYELDGKPALALYKSYLGPLADQLPASALHFPLSLRSSRDDDPVVRTILSIDEEAGSMTFAGDIPEGSIARLMRANYDRLIDAASTAAEQSARRISTSQPELALLISCVGRKLVLGQRVDEEVGAIGEQLKGQPVLAGFYSYGEISPSGGFMTCELHNQTMTVTTFSERSDV